MGDKTSAPVGGTKTVLAAGLTNACMVVPWKLPLDALTKPARSMTLWDAAYVVAYLADMEIIQLCAPGKGLPLRPPEFKKGCTGLTWPGPNASCAGRFCVDMRPQITIGPRTIKFKYFEKYDKNNQPVQLFDTPLFNVDVRNVVMIYHLTKALHRLKDTHGLEVTAILHIGIGGAQGTRTPGADGVWRPLDAHRSGRAIDFGGVTFKNGDAEETLMVLADWGLARLPNDAEKALLPGPPKQDPVVKEGYWPVYVDPGRPNWHEVNWKVMDPPTAAQAQKVFDAHANGRAPFRSTFYRLHDSIPPASEDEPKLPDTKRKCAALVFKTAFETFAKHATLTDAAPYEGSIPEGSLGSGPSDLCKDDHQSLLHPETRTPIYRAPHIDHIHAQVGPLSYEYPDQSAVAAAAAATAPAGQTFAPMPTTPRIANKGKPLEDALAPSDPSDPDD